MLFWEFPMAHIHIYLSEEQINSMSSDLIDEVTNYRTETVGMITPFYAYNDDFVRKCAEIERVANISRTYQKERARDALRCRMYSWNHLRNAYFLSDLGKVLPKDMPAIIVSAGPSLRKNVEVLP